MLLRSGSCSSQHLLDRSPPAVQAPRRCTRRSGARFTVMPARLVFRVRSRREAVLVCHRCRGVTQRSHPCPREVYHESHHYSFLYLLAFSLRTFKIIFSESKQFCFDLTAQVSCPAVEDSGGSPPTWGCILVSCGFRSVCSGRVSTVFIHT